MAESPAHIGLDLETRQPIEIGDFVAVFSSISSQYDRFVQANFPDLKQDAQIFVTELRPGSIHADLIPVVIATLAPIADDIRRVIVSRFLGYLIDRVSAYFKTGGRVAGASKADLNDFAGIVRAIANDSDGRSVIEAVYFEADEKKTIAALKFNTSQARAARQEIEAHRLELEKSTSADHPRVLMVFTQPNVKDTDVGKRSGERVIIESISEKEFPLIYASDLAEQRIKHEIREADDNPFKKGFVVDVNIEIRGGKPVAYRVAAFHGVIDLPDND